MYQIPGYNFVYENLKLNKKGGVAIYINKEIRYIERFDKAENHDAEFESIFLKPR